MLGAVLSGDVSNENDPTPEEEAEMEALFEEIRKEEGEDENADEAKPSFFDYLYPALLGAALLAFVIWFFFFR